MDSLSFADVSWHDLDIIEVCPHEDIEISAENMDELQTLISAHPGSMLLLVNRCHEYSYSFEAIRQIRALKNVKALALLFNNIHLSNSYIVRTIRGAKGHCKYPFETFLNKDDAIKWLRSYN